MNPNAKKKLIGAIIAAALAIAVYYGLIDQKQANSIQTQTDQTLGTGPATQQSAPQPTQAPQQQPAPQQGATTPAAPSQPTETPPPPH